MKYEYMYLCHGCREFQTLLFRILFVDPPKCKHFEIIQNMTLSTENATTVSTKNVTHFLKFSATMTYVHIFIFHIYIFRFRNPSTKTVTHFLWKLSHFFVETVVQWISEPPKFIEVRVTDPNTWGRETARKDKRERTRQREQYLRDPSNRITNVSRYKLKSDYFLWFNLNLHREIPKWVRNSTSHILNASYPICLQRVMHTSRTRRVIFLKKKMSQELNESQTQCVISHMSSTSDVHVTNSTSHFFASRESQFLDWVRFGDVKFQWNLLYFNVQQNGEKLSVFWVYKFKLDHNFHSNLLRRIAGNLKKHSDFLQSCATNSNENCGPIWICTEEREIFFLSSICGEYFQWKL